MQQSIGGLPRDSLRPERPQPPGRDRLHRVVGRAASDGVGFLPIYLGPTLMLVLWWFVVRKMIRIARTNRDPNLRRTALFWLGQSKDPRALDLFEELLTDG